MYHENRESPLPIALVHFKRKEKVKTELVLKIKDMKECLRKYMMILSFEV